MVPGAVDVVPLNVQLSVLPPLLIVQVSVSDGPERQSSPSRRSVRDGEPGLKPRRTNR
jgi:hypothetical protein